MTDKDLLVVISEMLIKQDQTNEHFSKFIDITVKQFDEQSKFNKLFLGELRNVKQEVTGVKHEVAAVKEEVAGVKQELIEVNQRLGKVDNAVHNLTDVHSRLKRLEAAVFKS